MRQTRQQMHPYVQNLMFAVYVKLWEQEGARKAKQKAELENGIQS